MSNLLPNMSKLGWPPAFMKPREPRRGNRPAFGTLTASAFDVNVLGRPTSRNGTPSAHPSGSDDPDRRVEHLAAHRAFAHGRRDRRGEDMADHLHPLDDLAENRIAEP